MPVLFVGLLLFGCTSNSRDSGALPCSTSALEPSVVILDGAASGVVLESASEVQIVFGPQGGFHVYLSVDSYGLEPGADNLSDGYANDDLLRVNWEVRMGDGMLSVPYEQRSVAEPVGEGWRIGPHLILLQYYEDPPPDYSVEEREQEIEASDIQVSVDVEDHCGVRVVASEMIRMKFSTAD